jgi:hypothetical protein
VTFDEVLNDEEPACPSAGWSGSSVDGLGGRGVSVR